VNSFVRFTPRGQTKFLGALCSFGLAIILVAGLWPFHAPLNDVHWSSPARGLIFGKHGSLLSTSQLRRQPPVTGQPCSLEIYLQPRRPDYAGTILGFYFLDRRDSGFILRQSLNDLKIESRSKSGSRKKLYVDAFSAAKPIVISIVSAEKGTSVYLDGALARTSSVVRLSTEDLAGRLVLGNAPSTTDSWSGKLMGLAVYDRELSAVEVSQHVSGWSRSRAPVDGEGALASYAFDEGAGTRLHSRAHGAPDLFIPERFFVLDEPFLRCPWDEFSPGRNYWEDVAINVFGFVPLGLCFSAYLSRTRTASRALFLAVAIGFTTSLWIEVLQSFLPTRNSGMTDLITNTFGTLLGAVVWAWAVNHGWLERFFPATDEKKGETRGSFN